MLMQNTLRTSKILLHPQNDIITHEDSIKNLSTEQGEVLHFTFSYRWEYAKSFFSNCHFYKCQAYRHTMLQKLTLIFIITKSLSRAKSLELFSTQFCSKENRKLSPSLFYFLPHVPQSKYTILYHTKNVLSILGLLWYIILCDFIPIFRGFFCLVP